MEINTCPLPVCYLRREYSEKSEFCVKVCKHAKRCGGDKVPDRDESEKVSSQYHSGKISFSEMIKKRVGIIKNRRNPLVIH